MRIDTLPPDGQPSKLVANGFYSKQEWERLQEAPDHKKKNCSMCGKLLHIEDLVPDEHGSENCADCNNL